MGQDPHQEVAAAIAAERAAWEKVKHSLPGTPGFDEAQWSVWQAAVQRCRAARLALDAAGATPPAEPSDRPTPGQG